MKYRYMIFAVSMSFTVLNAMKSPTAEDLNCRPLFDAPQIVNWQEMCKDTQEKQKLVNMYQDFCKKRVKNNMAWVIGSWIPFGSWASYSLKYPNRGSISVGVLTYFFTVHQTYFFVRNQLRRDLASQENLYYLNNDIWERLGYPEVSKRDIYPKNYWYRIGDPYRQTKYRINTVSDIERALSGKHPEGLDSKKKT